MTNPLVVAIPNTGNSPAATTRLNLSLAMALPLENAAAVAAFTTWDLATDNTLYPAVVYAGTVYEYDSADGSTAHDPAAGCITDASGRRYKRALNLKPDHIVIDKDLTAPPASPIEQAQYYVAVAATGAWAGHDKEIAIYGRQGWHFADVEEGHLLYVSDEAVYYHMAASGSLVKGMGNLALANGSIKPIHLLKNFGTPVEAEQNDPPVSMPGDGIAYIVGSVPTGGWAGQVSKIAISNSISWDFFDPYEGATVYDKTLKYLRRYEAGSWVRSAEKPATIKPIVIDAEQSGVSMVSNVWKTLKTVAITAKPTQIIKFEIEDFTIIGSSNVAFTIQLRVRRDSEITNVFYKTSGGVYTLTLSDILKIIPADDQEHIYKFEAVQSDPTRDFVIRVKAEIKIIDVATDTALDGGI